MTNARNSRARRGGGSKKRSNVVKKFSWQSRQDDAVVLRDTQFAFGFTTPASGTSSTGFAFNLANLGPRVSTISALFTRFRIIALRIRFVPTVGSTTAGLLTLGVVDDTDTVATGTTISPEQCRISSENSIWRNVTLYWEPIDKEKWYYTSNSTVSDTTPDPRLTTPATLVMATGGGAPVSTLVGNIYVDYEIVLKGATPNNLD